jgi:hypothetical protein
MSLSQRSVVVDLPARLTHFCPTCDWDACPPWRDRGRIVNRGYSSERRSWWRWVIVIVNVGLALTTPLSPLQAIDFNPTRGALTLVDRTVMQDQGAWIVDYRLRHTGKTGVIITPEEFEVKVEGWVSNSRVASHAMPRWSSLVISHGHDLSAVSEVITAADEAHRCRDRLVIFVWADDQRPAKLGTAAQPGANGVAGQAPPILPSEATGTLPISLGPGAIVHVRLRLEHQHILYGDYDPLLSVRAVTLALGSTPVRDVVPMDREQYLAQPRFTWHEPPEERRDTRHAISGPDSLHLEAHVPGHQYYRYPERPVRYNTKMRLRFWYLIAAGTEGECRVRVAQFKDTPTSWRILNSGGFEQCLKTVGRWTKVDRILQTEPEATTLTLEFKIVGETEVGEMWIDDVSLEPVDCTTPAGP